MMYLVDVVTVEKAISAIAINNLSDIRTEKDIRKDIASKYGRIPFEEGLSQHLFGTSGREKGVSLLSGGNKHRQWLLSQLHWGDETVVAHLFVFLCLHRKAAEVWLQEIKKVTSKF